MKRPTIKQRRHEALPGETLIEYINSKGVSGIMSLREMQDGALQIDLSTRDFGVRIVGAPMPVVRFIVDTYCSTPDKFGNVSRWSRITSTITARSISVSDVGGAQNIPHFVFNCIDNRGGDFDPWSAMHYGEHDIPRKLFGPPPGALYEGKLTREMVLALELPG